MRDHRQNKTTASGLDIPLYELLPATVVTVWPYHLERTTLQQAAKNKSHKVSQSLTIATRVVVRPLLKIELISHTCERTGGAIY